MYKIDKSFVYIAISDHQQQNEYWIRPNRTHYFTSIENTEHNEFCLGLFEQKKIESLVIYI